MGKQSPSFKNLIADLYSLTDDLNAQGQRMPRQTFKKDIHKGYLALKQALMDTIEVAIVDKEPKESPAEIQWLPYKGFVLPEGKKRVTNSFGGELERHTETDIEFTPAMIAALKHFYRDREELPDTTPEALEMLEELIK